MKIPLYRITAQQAVEAYSTILTGLRKLAYPGADYHSTMSWAEHLNFLMSEDGIRNLAFASVATGVLREPVIVALDLNGLTFPFVIAEDFYGEGECLMQPLDFLPEVNIFYATHLEELGYTDIVTNYPVIAFESVEEFLKTDGGMDDAFRRYLKAKVSNNVIPHFFGTKSEQVQWKMTLGHNQKMLQDLAIPFYEHRIRVTNKNEFNRPNSLTRANTAWFRSPNLSPTNIVAQTKEGKYICAMQVYDTISDVVVSAGSIAINHDPEFHPYSLALNAHLALIRETWFRKPGSTVKFLNLGVNFDSAGDYKDRLEHEKMPWYNFPVADYTGMLDEK